MSLNLNNRNEHKFSENMTLRNQKKPVGAKLGKKNNKENNQCGFGQQKKKWISNSDYKNL